MAEPTNPIFGIKTILRDSVIIAPKIEPAEQIRAYLNDFDCEPKHNAISKTSGGIGKNEASATAIKANATTPYFELDQFKTQL